MTATTQPPSSGLPPASDIPGYAFLEYVLTALVEEKDALKIEGKIDEQGVLLTVQASDKDMGKLIGKGGQTLKALRILLRIIGGNENQRINLKVLEPPSASASAEDTVDKEATRSTDSGQASGRPEGS